MSKALNICEKWAQRGPVGRFISPRSIGDMEATDKSLLWGADNDAFKAWDEERFVRMIDRFEHTDNCLFVAAPDVVEDAKQTLERFERWEPELHRRGLPVALVAQNGMEDMDLPWERFEALFLGGDTGWKLGSGARALTIEARQRGKWVHMGRVNSMKRLWYAMRNGCQSADGTGFSKFDEANMPKCIDAMNQPTLEFWQLGEAS